MDSMRELLCRTVGFAGCESSGVGLAFALGLLTAGLLHLPYQSAAQQQTGADHQR